MALRTVPNAGMQNVMVTETIQDEFVEQGVRRFIRGLSARRLRTWRMQ
ncbi:MAG: hypothetical protein OXI44_02255 [Bacteroidota bacterium]|nr:hypothetical protein [Bacteroidota bacterium]